MFPDITLILGFSEFKAHSTILMPKSTWFANNCPGKSELKLILPSAALLKYSTFDRLDQMEFDRALGTMISFCYQGNYDLLNQDDSMVMNEVRDVRKKVYSRKVQGSPLDVICARRPWTLFQGKDNQMVAVTRILKAGSTRLDIDLNHVGLKLLILYICHMVPCTNQNPRFNQWVVQKRITVLQTPGTDRFSIVAGTLY